ncbi:hypothetical protein NBRC116188_18870 [Oceaniserpentilla sp. 4NH20-0058]|uniref:DUF6122 family protein n=1 Tax=Oceaniserpentilla sp. 4NH20-0058 TaxID=3127660 RepID=UPI0031084245
MTSVVVWLNENRPILHMMLHGLVPLIVAWFCAKRGNIKFVFLIMLATMVVDVDHLLATPIYKADRCSILFHPLHQVWAFAIYAVMVTWPVLLHGMNKPIRTWQRVMGWVGLGLIIHMLLDGLDCIWMQLS